jgi:aminoglycoside/choline kinase family phosphotransferase
MSVKLLQERLSELQPFLERNGFRIEDGAALPDEGSARRYYRFQSGGRSAILCLDTPFRIESSDFLKIGRYLKEHGASVPAVLDLDERGWMLLEDAGMESLESLYRRDPAAGEVAYRAAIDELALWHRMKPPEIVAGRFFDFERLWWEMEFLFARLNRLSDLLQKDLRPSFEVQMFLRSACEHLGSSSPLVFTHRDFHARNIMVPDSSNPGHVVIIDFQDARMGLPWYDLSSLLYDPYSDLTAEKRRSWFQYYCSISGLKLERQVIEENQYYLQALQRIFKALGSYLFLTFEKGKYFYIQSIEPALRRLEEIVLLGHFPDSVYLYVKEMRTVHLDSLLNLSNRMASPP